MNIAIPSQSLVMLIGPAGSGKTTFARRHFLPTEVLSSDSFRALISDDESDQTATNEAFDVLHIVARKRLARGKLTVVDATNVQPEARRPLIRLAGTYHRTAVGIVFYLPREICLARNRERSDRTLESCVINRQWDQMDMSLSSLKSEGFDILYILDSQEKIEKARIERTSP